MRELIDAAKAVIDCWDRHWPIESRMRRLKNAVERAESQEPGRRDVLLKAAYDLLKKCDESRYILNAMAVTVHYDDTECDGTCLMNEIAAELGIEDVPFTWDREDEDE